MKILTNELLTSILENDYSTRVIDFNIINEDLVECKLACNNIENASMQTLSKICKIKFIESGLSYTCSYDSLIKTFKCVVGDLDEIFYGDTEEDSIFGAYKSFIEIN